MQSNDFKLDAANVVWNQALVAFFVETNNKKEQQTMTKKKNGKNTSTQYTNSENGTVLFVKFLFSVK